MRGQPCCLHQRGPLGPSAGCRRLWASVVGLELQALPAPLCRPQRSPHQARSGNSHQWGLEGVKFYTLLASTSLFQRTCPVRGKLTERAKQYPCLTDFLTLRRSQARGSWWKEGIVGPGSPRQSSYSTDNSFWSVTGEWINYFNCSACMLQMLTNFSNITQFTPWSFKQGERLMLIVGNKKIQHSVHCDSSARLNISLKSRKFTIYSLTEVG